VHLRLCRTCGHVGCCDDSKNKHATAHFHSTGHPVIESLEPGEGWRWCYVDEVLIPSEIDGADEPAVERENVMLDDTRSPISVIDGTTFSPRQSLPLVGDTSANGRSRGMFKSICQRVRRCNKKNLEPTIELAVEIAREGREGRRIGTLFTFGDADRVLARSRPLILDPLAGHSEQSREIRDQNLRGTIKELAQLDGAFVVSDQGIVVSACRYLDAMASDVVLPYGMASRHLAGASISQVTDAVAIVVSESSMVRVFDDGKLVAEIIPELWLMDHYNVQLSQPYEEERIGDLAVITAKA
jgi:DNA integrity scanning protein DisA with diadenylate cyclase activity